MNAKENYDLLYVELPNLVNRILKERTKPRSKMGTFEMACDEIKKIVDAEIKSATTAYLELKKF